MSKRAKEYEILTYDQIPEVKEEPVEVMGKVVKNFKSIVNCETEEPMHIVGKDYQVTQHRDVFNTVASLPGYKIEHATMYRDGRVICIEVAKQGDGLIDLLQTDDKDQLKPMVRISNSYDFTKALSVASYGLRLVCTNGMVAPGFTDRYRRQHSFANISLDEIAEAVKLGMHAWIESRDTIMEANKTMAKSEETILKLKYPKKYTARMVDQVKSVDTVYNIWNGITWVITHDIKEHVQTDRLIEFQQTANKVFTNYVKP